MLENEFDEEKALLNPQDLQKKIKDFPKIGVACFSKEIIDHVVKSFKGKKIAEFWCVSGNIPIYKINYKDLEIAFFMLRLGGPAAGISYEDAMAMGLDKLIAFGTCGVLDKAIEDLSIIIPTKAYRSDGLSYHYEKANEFINVNEKYVNLFEDILKEHQYSYTKGYVWTTDALYRETKRKMEEKKKKGCICVDMECASLSAIAKFRKKDFFEFFYAADNLDGAKWDKRSLACKDELSEKEKMAVLAFELALKISKKD